MEKDLSPHESLSIIQSMIDKTKYTLSDSSHYFLMWGYAVLTGCVLQYSLLSAGYEKHSLAWLIMLAALVLHFVFVFRDSKKEKATTYIGDANGYLWMGIGISFSVMVFLFARIGFEYCFPFYILFYALGTFVSGNLIQFKPLIVGGAISFVLAIAASFVKYEYQILLTAASIFISYIIPGHLLRSQYRKQIALS
jgi:hypothetical protein